MAALVMRCCVGYKYHKVCKTFKSRVSVVCFLGVLLCSVIYLTVAVLALQRKMLNFPCSSFMLCEDAKYRL